MQQRGGGSLHPLQVSPKSSLHPHSTSFLHSSSARSSAPTQPFFDPYIIPDERIRPRSRSFELPLRFRRKPILTSTLILRIRKPSPVYFSSIASEKLLGVGLCYEYQRMQKSIMDSESYFVRGRNEAMGVYSFRLLKQALCLLFSDMFFCLCKWVCPSCLLRLRKNHQKWRF